MNIAALLEAQDFLGIEQYCHAAIKQSNGSAEIWFYLAVAYQHQFKHAEALDALQTILEITKDNVAVLSLHAAVLASLKRYQPALEAAKKVLEIEPGNVEHLSNAGAICQQSGDFEQAIRFYQEMLAFDATHTAAIINLGTTLVLAGQYHQAITHCRKAIEALPNTTVLYSITSEALIQLGDWDSALLACESGLQSNPDFAFLWFRRGLLLSYLCHFVEAQQAFDRAKTLQPDIILEYFQSAMQFSRYQPVDVEMNPRLIFLEMAYIGLTKCDWRLWSSFPQVMAEYVQATKHEVSKTLAFRVFNRPVSPMLRLNLMQTISTSVKEHAHLLQSKPYQHDARVRPQLRIGYISADFYQHPTAILTRQLYKLHDRLKYKVYAYSLVAKNEDIYQKEIASACDVFRDVSTMTELKIADLIYADEIDILVDLGQYATPDGKLEVLALRPAPVQVNYLAFMATTGADFIDYAIVDHHICPSDKRSDWSESVVRLPHSLFMYDSTIATLPIKSCRNDHGLPDDGVVFCCFNNDYKIEPGIFTLWMSLLKAVPNSVLWLLGSNQDACTKLTTEALRLDVEKNRIVFAGRVSLELHIQRYQLADIFLDTYWFNGHTTALEALWQGLPVLTRCGDVTSSRVATSFLNVLGLPELIVHSEDEYLSRAIYYAENHEAREALRDKLAKNRTTSPLFNTALTVKHLELAYELVWNRYLNNLKPKDIDVPAITVLKW